MKFVASKAPLKERGAVMITALMILLLMTVFGISTMDSNILEERMAGNMRDRNTAFQAAESALRAAEVWIQAQSAFDKVRDVTDPDDTNPLWDMNTPDPDATNSIPWWAEDEWNDPDPDDNWWNQRAVVLSGGDALPSGTGADEILIAEQPAYIVEKLPPSTESLEAAQSLDASDIYLQVTARGVGGSASTIVVLQSVYKW